MDALGLVIWYYEAEGKRVLAFPSWDSHQWGLERRVHSEFPPPNEACVRVVTDELTPEAKEAWRQAMQQERDREAEYKKREARQKQREGPKPLQEASYIAEALGHPEAAGRIGKAVTTYTEATVASALDSTKRAMRSEEPPKNAVAYFLGAAKKIDAEATAKDEGR